MRPYRDGLGPDGFPGPNHGGRQTRKDREVRSSGAIVGVGGQVFNINAQCSAKVSGAAGGDGETGGEGYFRLIGRNGTFGSGFLGGR